MSKYSKNPHRHPTGAGSCKPQWWDALIGVVPGVTDWQPQLVDSHPPFPLPAAGHEKFGIAPSRNDRLPEKGDLQRRPGTPPMACGSRTGRDGRLLFEPARVTPLHAWHVRRGAEFEDTGLWRRPWFFPKQGENLHQAVARECQASRRSVGIMDTSARGGIVIQGADARTLLNRTYTHTGLDVGKCCYGQLRKEDGSLIDDDVITCLGDNRFLITPHDDTEGVLQWLELWQRSECPELEVSLTDVTDHWATMTVSGPASRKVLEKVAEDVELSGKTFRPMDWRPATLAGVEAHIFRISFTGELSFDVKVRASYGLYVWEALMEAGDEFSITPCGTEAMQVLMA
ncbi:aminomethyltransferase family protein [Zobellella maritima]|uniref:hypothetical protein n=1 Tax=Zobellella maritima TaxID=2059725 RepID=UPI001E29C3CE|nr:hypothetical protein [Zobellella maritima]